MTNEKMHALAEGLMNRPEWKDAIHEVVKMAGEAGYQAMIAGFLLGYRSCHDDFKTGKIEMKVATDGTD
jgi:hypothetical protein